MMTSAFDNYPDNSSEYITFHTITISKSRTDDRIGLTLHYRQTNDDTLTDVIVGKIDPSCAIAESNIQAGDRIVEINETPIRSRDQVLEMLCGASGGRAINLTLARCGMTSRDIELIDDEDQDANNIDPGFDDIDDIKDIKKYQLQSDTQSPIVGMGHPPSGRILECIDEEDDLSDQDTESARRSEEVDSGLSKTDESIRNDESSEQDTDSPTGFLSHSSRLHVDCDSTHNRGSSVLGINSNDGNFVLLPSTVTNIPCRGRSIQTSPPNSSDRPPLPPPRSRSTPRTAERHSNAVAFDPASLISVVSKKLLLTDDEDVRNLAQRSVRRVPRMGTRLNLNLNLNAAPSFGDPLDSNTPLSPCLIDRRRCEDKTSTTPEGGNDYCVIEEWTHDTTSACHKLCSRSPVNHANRRDALNNEVRPVPPHYLDFDRVCSPPPLPFVPLLSPPPSRTRRLAAPIADNSPDARMISPRSRQVPSSETSRGTQTLHPSTPSASAAEAYKQCADVMYTNHANLQHTIAVQQQLFRQQLAKRRTCVASTIATPSSTDQLSGPMDNSTSGRRRDVDASSRNQVGSSSRIEWVVKKRSDGSRYVARRPAVNDPTPVDSLRRRAASSMVKAAGRGHLAEAWTTTTDDDEDGGESPKAGRYWTREQRRQHVADRRRRAAMRQREREQLAAVAILSPTDNCRSRRPTSGSRARRTVTSDVPVNDGPGCDERHSAKNGRQIGFNATGRLLSVATV